MKSLLLLSQITVKIVVLFLPCYSFSGKLFHLSGPCLLICKLGGWLGHLLVTRKESLILDVASAGLHLGDGIAHVIQDGTPA